MIQRIQYDEYTTVEIDCNEIVEHDVLYAILNENEWDRVHENFLLKRKETLVTEGIVFAIEI
jgi:hypothetical protein